MIDSHCHLEQPEYDKDREKIIGECKKKLKAVVTCCAHPKDIGLTLDLVKEYPGFVFATIGIHPEFIKELSEEDINLTIKKVEENKEQIVAIGEIGLDYFWIKEKKWQEKQKILFERMIKLANRLNKPLVIHSRDSSEDAINILEENGMKNKKVLMHSFREKKLLPRVIENGFYISIGPGILKSKDIRKIARDMPLNKIMLETDSPWFAQPGQDKGTPLNVKVAAQKIAEIKHLTTKEVEEQTDINTINFYSLKIKNKK